jgi:hypothetical protein
MVRRLAVTGGLTVLLVSVFAEAHVWPRRQGHVDRNSIRKIAMQCASRAPAYRKEDSPMPQRPSQIDHVILPTHRNRWRKALHFALEHRKQEGWRLVGVLRGHAREDEGWSNAASSGPAILTLIFQR